MKEHTLSRMWGVVLALLFASSYAICEESCYSIKGDFLYFEPQENGLSYGFVSTGENLLRNFVTDPTGDFKFLTEVKKPDFKWDGGCRFEGRFEPNCVPLICYLKWMHFTSQTKDHLFLNNSPEYFIGTWSNPTFFVLSKFIDPYEIDFPFDILISLSRDQTARSKFKFRLNTYDLGWKYVLCPSECLTLSPSIGLQVVHIDQGYCLLNTLFGKLRVFNTEEGENGIANGEYVENIRFKNDFLGVGLQTGVETDYQLGCGWSLFGTLTGSLLKGKFHLKGLYETELFFEEGNAENPDVFKKEYLLKQKNTFCVIRSILDLGIGLRWKTCVMCYPLTLQIAWEQHSFFGQNQIQDFGFALTADDGLSGFQQGIQQSNRGDLTLQGWAFSGKIEF